MSYTTLLINSCTVRRYTTGAADSWGALEETWGNHLTDQDCRIAIPKGREIMVGAEVVVADYVLFTQDIDVTEQDRIVLDGVTYEILLVKPLQDSTTDHHLELYLRVVR